MGMVHHLLIAEPSEAQTIAVHNDPSQNWDGFYCQGLDRIKLAALWAVIEGGSPNDQFDWRMDSIQTISAGENGPWVDVTPPKMVAALASVAAMDEDEIQGVAASLSAMEDFLGWSQTDIFDLVRSIGDCAETAQLKNKVIMIFTSF